jgi:hypothetical protein
LLNCANKLVTHSPRPYLKESLDFFGCEESPFSGLEVAGGDVAEFGAGELYFYEELAWKYRLIYRRNTHALSLVFVIG